MEAREVAYLFLLVVAPPASFYAKAYGSQSAAVVESVSGIVRAGPPGGPVRGVNSLDWLAPGEALEVAAKSSVTLVLLNGSRYRLGGAARATVTAGSLQGVRGPVELLSKLPPLPSIASIAGGVARASGAVRFRNPSKIGSFYPREGVVVLPDLARLSFSTVARASIYQVDLIDEDENSLLRRRTVNGSVEVPPGVLRPGSRYSWRVRALGDIGVIAEAGAAFSTIGETELQARANFADMLRQVAGGAAALAVLGEIDFQLGLIEEARREFQAALELQPGDLQYRSALQRVEAALRGAPQK